MHVFPFFSLKPHGGFLKWGFPKWLVYNGQSYLNGWFGDTPIVHTGPERPGWSWACSGLAPYSLPSVQVGVDWGVLQITWSDTYSICCELTWIDREFLEDRHKIVDVPLSAWLPIQDVTAVIFWFMSNCWPLLKCLRHFQHAPAVDLDSGRSRLQCHHASRWDGSVTLSKHNPKFGITVWNIYLYTYNYTPRPGVPPRSLSCHQLFRVCLGFVQGLFRVYPGFHLGLLGLFFTMVLIRCYYHGLLRVSYIL